MSRPPPRDAAVDAAAAAEDVEPLLPLDASPVDPAARGWLSGLAWDARTGEPIEGVELAVGGAVLGRSDGAGAWSLVLPRGMVTLTARAAGRLPIVRRIVVAESPVTLDLPFTAPEPATMVTPGGATITTRQGVTLRFPADAVRAPISVTATWLDGDAVAALDGPTTVSEGDTEATLHGALVVSDLRVEAPVRVEIPIPQDVLPTSVSLRPMGDGDVGARLPPVSTDEGTAVFDVPHFSTWGLWVDYPTVTAAAADCGGQRLGAADYVNLATYDMQVERGTQRIRLSPVNTMEAARGITRVPPVPLFCGDVVRSAGRMSFRASGPFGIVTVSGERFAFRVTGTDQDLRMVALPPEGAEAPVEISAFVLDGSAVRIFPENSLQVVAEGGATAVLRRIRCSAGSGWSITHATQSLGGHVTISDRRGRYALSAGTEALFCTGFNATPAGRLTPAQGSCLLPTDCAAPTRCDPAAQRCVLPRGAACAEGGPPCDPGAAAPPTGSAPRGSAAPRPSA